MLPSLLPSFRGNTLFPPLCARTAPDAFHPASRFEIAEQAPDHIAANGGTKPLEIRDSELAGDRFNRMFHHFSLGSARAFHLSEPLLKFFAGQRKNKKQEIDSGPGIVFALVPALGALFQHFVIALFVFFDDAFKADVAAHFQAAMIIPKEGVTKRTPSVSPFRERRPERCPSVAWGSPSPKKPSKCCLDLILFDGQDSVQIVERWKKSS